MILNILRESAGSTVSLGSRVIPFELAKNMREGAGSTVFRRHIFSFLALTGGLTRCGNGFSAAGATRFPHPSTASLGVPE